MADTPDEQQGAAIEYGKRTMTETYFDGKMRSIEITSTEAVNATNTQDAMELSTKKVLDCIFNGEARKSIIVQFDLDDRARSENKIKRIHVTHTTTKQHIPVRKRRKLLP